MMGDREAAANNGKDDDTSTWPYRVRLDWITVTESPSEAIVLYQDRVSHHDDGNGTLPLCNSHSQGLSSLCKDVT